MKYCFLFIVLFIHYAGYAQKNAMIGVVMDAETAQPISSCNVFISNTSIGKITNAEGKFSLYEIPESKSYDLVVSCVGYETFTYTFSSAALPLNLQIKLNKKIVEMQNVQIVPLEKDGWEKWGGLFLKYFIGESQNSKHCKIKNTESLEFRKYKAENLLEVTTDEILIIQNNRLGYNIKYQLESFTYNFKTNMVSYTGYPLFEEMETVVKISSKFTRRRQKAYYGSSMHFVRSLYKNTLPEEGFDVRRMVRSYVNDTIRIYKKGMTLYIFDSLGNKKEMPDNYVKKRMVETVGSKSLSADSIVFMGRDSARDILAFNDYLYVRYLKESESIEFSNLFRRTGLPYQISTFNIINDEKNILLIPSGYYYPSLELVIEGYMGWEKIGDLLPLDYVPPVNDEAK